MTANDTFEFSVQQYEHDGAGGLSLIAEPVKVTARSALEAGQQVLGEDLVLHGAPHHLRAKVWRIGEDFKPIDTLLYQLPAEQEV